MKRSRATVYIAWLITLAMIFFIVALIYSRFNTRSPIVISGIPYEHAFFIKGHPKLSKNQRVVRVLSVEGGAIHGILPAYMLNYLSKKTGKPVTELFDVMAGTSSGSITVTTLNTPNSQGQPKYNTKDLIGIYNHIGPQLLHNPWYHKLLTFDGLIGPMLPASNLDRAFEHYLGKDTRFDQLIKPVVVPVYNVQERHVIFFKSWLAGKNNKPDYYTHQVVSAATATPGVFPPVVIQSLNTQKRILVADAFNAVNQPDAVALSAAIKLFPNRKYLLISLGTGQSSPPINPDQALYWGLAKWMDYILIDFMRGQVSQTIRNMENLQHFIPNRLTYYHIDGQLPPTVYDPFNVSPSSMKALNQAAQNIVKQHKKELDKIACELSPQSCQKPSK